MTCEPETGRESVQKPGKNEVVETKPRRGAVHHRLGENLHSAYTRIGYDRDVTIRPHSVDWNMVLRCTCASSSESNRTR
jgi:hypothetical protein